jgi:hypothetical protein
VYTAPAAGALRAAGDATAAPALPLWLSTDAPSAVTTPAVLSHPTTLRLMAIPRLSLLDG